MSLTYEAFWLANWGVVANPKASTLTDDFATQDTAKWTYGPGSSVTGGQLVIPAPSPQGTYVEVNSVARHDLTASSILVEMVDYLRNTYTAETIFDLINSSGHRLRMFVEGQGSLVCRRLDTSTTNVNTPYDPVAMRFFRMREAAGTVYYETSPDATAWTERWNSPALSTGIDALRVVLSAGNYDAAMTATGTALFDNVNVVPAAPVVVPFAAFGIPL